MLLVLVTTLAMPPPPAADWVVLFRPDSLAIYPRAALRPAPPPAPLATFALPPPLALTHLYPPRTHLTHSRAPPAGPRPPLPFAPAHGPTFAVLTSSRLLLFHPQQLPATPVAAWRMNVIQCPLHTRWHATSAGPAPPDADSPIDRGWMDIVPGAQGVWVGWQRGDTAGVLRAEIGVDKAGNHCASSCPSHTTHHADPDSRSNGPNDVACRDASAVSRRRPTYEDTLHASVHVVHLSAVPGERRNDCGKSGGRPRV